MTVEEAQARPLITVFRAFRVLEDEKVLLEPQVLEPEEDVVASVQLIGLGHRAEQDEQPQDPEHHRCAGQ